MDGVKFRWILTGEVFTALIINYVTKEVRYKAAMSKAWCVLKFEDIEIVDKSLDIGGAI